MPACGITASGGDRKTKAAAVVPARDRALLRTTSATARPLARPAIGRGRPAAVSVLLLAVHEDRSQPVCLLKHGRVRARLAGLLAAAALWLVKVANDAVLLDGRDVVRKIELRRPKPSSVRSTDQTVGLYRERDRERLGFHDPANASRWRALTRHCAQRIELIDVRPVPK
jgi:hypothetical protein